MKKQLATIALSTFIAISSIAFAENSLSTETEVTSTETTWKPLSEFKFVSGRTATAEDFAEGKAIFLSMDMEKQYIGKAIDIEIPQYAYIQDEDTNGKKIPVVIVQAEEAHNIPIVGYINLLDNSKAMSVLPSFILLGKTPPNIPVN